MMKTFAGVSEAHFLEAYPLPWEAVRHAGTNRSAVIASDGTQIINGMNNTKAAFIADSVSRTDLRESLELAIRHIEHMSAWITKQNAGYSFESLGEDLPGIRAPLGKAP